MVHSRVSSLILNPNTHLLEQDPYSYQLQDIPEPELFREIYPYTEVPCGRPDRPRSRYDIHTSGRYHRSFA